MSNDLPELTDAERIDYHRGVAERALAAQHDIARERDEARALLAEERCKHALTMAAEDASSADVRKLRAALKPFAQWIDKLDVEFSDHSDDVIAGGVDGATVTFGDLRSARSALGDSPNA